MASKAKKTRRRGQKQQPRLGMGVLLAVFSAIITVVIVMALTRASQAPASAATAPALPADTGYCRSTPAFIADPNIVDPALIGGGSIAFATDRAEKGLVLLSTVPGAAPFQLPTWDDAGFLGSIAYDGRGDIYAAPTPRLSLQDNPLAGQSTLWRVDASSGEMRPFVTIAGEASERNPYGVLGLTYDCVHNRLYAGSVLGSTPSAERGGVVAIDLDTMEQTPIFRDLDTMGVLVAQVGEGHELYAGLARSPEIVAVSLDADGNAASEPRLLIDLTEAGAAPSERARKLRLVNGTLTVDLVPFNYSLQSSASDQPQLRQAAWTYDPSTGAWVVSQPAADVSSS